MTESTFSERQDALREILAPIDPDRFTANEIIQMCGEWLPGCTVDEIIEALRACAKGHIEHANRLRQRNSVAANDG